MQGRAASDCRVGQLGRAAGYGQGESARYMQGRAAIESRAGQLDTCTAGQLGSCRAIFVRSGLVQRIKACFAIAALGCWQGALVFTIFTSSVW